ncbi:helix-turn-helix transcriptional regulator [Amycolatopsis benzoatilytica]|uniref:helix-turn-helix transcriptional regulator n=1 Tax=Amycolatopsis benzoatilytica TaxID=346045 RepID=UPI00035FD563|nr:helix-turn-helix transcriptional regulator [Amycolatopsis benzoatilytica]
MARSPRPLANRRVVVGFTQEALAEALGVDRTTIGRWERGEQQPQPWQRPDLALKLGVTLEELDGLLRHPGPELPTAPAESGTVGLSS